MEPRNSLRRTGLFGGPERIVEVLLTVGRDLPGLISGGALHIDMKLFEEYLSDAPEQS